MKVCIAGMIAGLLLTFGGSVLAADKDIYNYDAQAAAPAGTKRIVFIATHGTHGGIGSHEFLAGSIYLARRINEVYPNAYAVVYTEDKWPTDLSKADSIIILLNHGGKAAQNPQVKAACDRGAGFMAIHWGTEVNKGAQGANYLAWMGGYCETFLSVNPFWKPEMIIGTHPTTNGVKPFAIVDEWYYHMHFVDGMVGVTPILSAIAPLNTVHFKEGDKPSERGGNPDVLKSVQNKEPQVMAWAYTRKDGGRGFGFTGYHVFNNLANDSFRTTLLNGVAWVSGLEISENGVPSSTPTKDEMAALIHEAHPAAK
ncbi:MAG TPA: ThuA domain-containing protein [Tepidisphaeraceae bacterium]|nr:ThuA domain-containing protein [Tepidisphaeraceae bacterium]